jgi:hypothetical protein
MKIAIMQPYLFPYIGYFQLIDAVDKFVIFDDVNYITKGWINRNRILLNGKDFLFTISLKGASQNKLIRETDIDETDKWRNKLIKTFEAAYSKAPFYKEVSPMLNEILNNREDNLSTFILYSINRIASYLDIKTGIIPSSEPYGNQNLKGEDRIIDICLQEKAAEYVNPIGGMELYSRPKFQANDIQLFFLKTQLIEYKQFGKEFVPWLSIIDLLMFCSPDEVKNFLKKRELI